MEYLIQARKPYLVLIYKKRTCHIMDFAVLANNTMKAKEGVKLDKYLDFARGLRKLWNMKVTMIPIIVRKRDSIHRRFEEEFKPFELQHF